MNIQIKKRFLANLLLFSLFCLKAETLSEDHQILLSSDAFHRGILLPLKKAI